MKSMLFRVVLSLLSFAPLLASAAAIKSPVDHNIAQQIRRRLDAYSHGQSSQWASFVSDDCFCAGETKGEIVKSIQNRPAAVRNWFGDILDLQIHSYGNTAVVRYRVTELTEVNGNLNTLEEWRIETHLLRAGRWTLVAAAANPITPDPTPIKVSQDVLRRYVGIYQYVPGSVDTVTLEDGRLFVYSPLGSQR